MNKNPLHSNIAQGAILFVAVFLWLCYGFLSVCAFGIVLMILDIIFSSIFRDY